MLAYGVGTFTGQKSTSGSLKLQLQVAMSTLTWMLEAASESSAKAASRLNH